MAIPLIGDITSIRGQAAQRLENEKNRKQERDMALKQFGQNIGLALVKSVADLGLDTASRYVQEGLDRPYKLADRGVSEVELPEPDKIDQVGSKVAEWYSKPAKPVAQPVEAPPVSAPEELPAAAPEAVKPPEAEPPFVGPPRPETGVKERSAAQAAQKGLNPAMLSRARERIPAVEDTEFAQELMRQAESGDQDALDAILEMPSRPLGGGVSPAAGAPARPQGVDRVVGPQPGEKMIPGTDTLIIKDKGAERRIQIPPGPPSVSPPQPSTPFAGGPGGLTAAGQAGLRAQFAALAKERNKTGFDSDTVRARQIAKLPPKERAFYQAAELKRRDIESDIGLRGAQARNIRAEARMREASLGAGPDQKKAAEIQKLQEENFIRTAAQFRGREADLAANQRPLYEQAKQAHNQRLATLAKAYEKRVSGSSGKNAPGGGGVSISGSASTNYPGTSVGIVRDEYGWDFAVRPSVEDVTVTLPNGRQKTQKQTLYTGQDLSGQTRKYRMDVVKTPNGPVITWTQVDVNAAAGPISPQSGGGPVGRPTRPKGQGTTAGTAPAGVTPAVPTTTASSAPSAPTVSTNVDDPVAAQEARLAAAQAAHKDLVTQFVGKATAESSAKVTKAVEAIEAEKIELDRIKKAEEDFRTTVREKATAAGGTLQPYTPQPPKPEALTAAYEAAGLPKGDKMDRGLPGSVIKKALAGVQLPDDEKGKKSVLMSLGRTKEQRDQIISAYEGIRQQAENIRQRLQTEAEQKHYYDLLNPVRQKYNSLYGIKGTQEGFYQKLEKEGLVVPPRIRTLLKGQIDESQAPSKPDPLQELASRIDQNNWSAARKRRVFIAEAKKRGLA